MGMDKFRQHYLGLNGRAREALASTAGTTTGLLHQIVYGRKQIELGLADCLVALCDGITLDDLPLTDRAKHHARVRVMPASEAPELSEQKEGA